MTHVRAYAFFLKDGARKPSREIVLRRNAYVACAAANLLLFRLRWWVIVLFVFYLHIGLGRFLSAFRRQLRQGGRNPF